MTPVPTANVLHKLLFHFVLSRFIFFFFTDTATTEIYTLSLHDALPISPNNGATSTAPPVVPLRQVATITPSLDRKSTRLNSSHTVISYAVFCLKKKKIRDKRSMNRMYRPRNATVIARMRPSTEQQCVEQ